MNVICKNAEILYVSSEEGGYVTNYNVQRLYIPVRCGAHNVIENSNEFSGRQDASVM